MSVNTEAETSVVFYLVYEELLARHSGIYQYTVSIIITVIIITVIIITVNIITVIIVTVIIIIDHLHHCYCQVNIMPQLKLASYSVGVSITETTNISHIGVRRLSLKRREDSDSDQGDSEETVEGAEIMMSPTDPGKVNVIIIITTILITVIVMIIR